MKKSLLFVAALLVSAIAMADITITPESGFKSAYGSSEYTITVNEINFTVSGMQYNVKNQPSGLAKQQVIQARKSSSGAGSLTNDSELNLKSITIATQNDKDFTLSAGVASDALSEVTKPTGTAAKYACKASDDTDIEIDVTVYTFNVTGMKYFELLNGSAASYFAYITIEEGTATDIDNVVEAPKTFKTIYNGQVVIVRDGVRYNTVGQVVE